MCIVPPLVLSVYRKAYLRGPFNSREHECGYVVIFPVSSPHSLRFLHGLTQHSVWYDYGKRTGAILDVKYDSSGDLGPGRCDHR
jgi:hypothetical protein